MKGHKLDSNYGPSVADTSARIGWGFAHSTVLVVRNLKTASALAEAYRYDCDTMFTKNTAMTLYQEGNV